MADFYDEKYYIYLQVDPNAEQEVIEGAYKRLLKKYHPDNNPSPEAAEKMKNINAAYEVLGNPDTREEYDAWLKSRQSSNHANSAKSANNDKRILRFFSGSQGFALSEEEEQQLDEYYHDVYLDMQNLQDGLRKYGTDRMLYTLRHACSFFREIIETITDAYVGGDRGYVAAKDVFHTTENLYNHGYIDQSTRDLFSSLSHYGNVGSHKDMELNDNEFYTIKRNYDDLCRYIKTFLLIFPAPGRINSDYQKKFEEVREKDLSQQTQNYSNYNNSGSKRTGGVWGMVGLMVVLRIGVPLVIFGVIISAMTGNSIPKQSRRSSQTRNVTATSTTAPSTASSKNNSSYKAAESESETETEEHLPEYEIAQDGTNIRKEASKESDKLGQLDLGETITGTGEISEDEKWAEVYYPDEKSTGWVKLSHVTTDSVEDVSDSDEFPEYVVTAENTLNVRESASAESAAIASISHGEVVSGTGKISDDAKWTEIYLPENTSETGWVYSQHIEETTIDKSEEVSASDPIEMIEEGNYPSATNSYNLTLSVVSISGNHVQLHYDNDNLVETYSLGWVGNSTISLKTDVKTYEATIDGPFMPEKISASSSGEITADFGEIIEGTPQSLSINPICRLSNGNLPADPNLSSSSNTMTIYF